VPKRLRFFLEREPKAVSAILHIFLRVVEAHLRQRIPEASARARLGAASFVHRFGSALNRHVHYHCCILDGLLEPLEDGLVRFLPAPALTAKDIAGIGEEVRRRVLRWFARSGRLEAEDARNRLGWDKGGFSLDASVRIAGRDRAGLERRLRYCAHPLAVRPRRVAPGQRSLDWNVRYPDSTCEPPSGPERPELAAM
jgi:hypothetical protein